jgi:fatty-acyl-CoA synthase
VKGPTLHAALDSIAAERSHVAISFPGEQTELTLAALRADSRSIAARLHGLGIRTGDRIGTLCSNEPDFLLLLFALSRLGACVCPLPLPVTSRSDYPAKVRGILNNAGIKIIALSPRMSRIRTLIDQTLRGHQVISAAELRQAPCLMAEACGHEVSGDQEIVLQYTSGSTASPKGVRLTHANVLAGTEAIRVGADLRASDRSAIWLPFFHDMGLFGLLAATLAGAPTTVWQPSFFVKDPACWLREIAHGGYSVIPMPNFAYDYLVHAVPEDEAAHYDLSRWRVAFNGAEPVAVDSVETFLAHFGPAGFAPTAMLPVYGLAEATLAATFPPLERGPVFDWVDRAALAGQRVAVPASRTDPGARGLVSVGRPVLGMSVRIADSGSGAPLVDRQVGEVQLRGPSVTIGYAGDAAAPPPPFSVDGWLRTGDLGYLAGGELYITGRIKEMIILRGANYYPDDVECAVRMDPGVYRRRCVAFVHQTVERESMALVVETSRPVYEHDEIAERLRVIVRSVIGLDDLMIKLAPPDSIPRTTSGKLQRLASKDRFAGEMSTTRKRNDAHC